MKQHAKRSLCTLLAASLLLASCAKPPRGDAAPDATAQIVAIGVEDGAAASPPATSGAGSSMPGDLPVLETPPAPQDDALRVLFINVGKADAALVCYGGKSALIDTGTEESAPQLLGALAFMGVERLDALYLTHTHSDHIGGVPMLGRYLPISQAYAAHFSENKKNGENKIDLAANDAGLPLNRLVCGDAVALAGDVFFTVLGPRAYNDDDDNDNSLVLLLACNGRRLLFTGDMQFAEEETLLSAGVDVSCDVLKVGNHGNPDATGDAFAKAVSPSVAVISTDTAVDDDSANVRVLAALSNADVRLTQNTALGVLLTILPGGDMTLENVSPQRAQASLAITEIDRNTQTLTLQNNGDAMDLSGCMLLSSRGGELYRFPAGSMLASDATATVAAEGHSGDYTFTGESSPWHKKKADTAILYDRFGLELARR